MDEKITLENDGLNRKDFITKFFRFIDTFGDQGLTLVLNGKYGSGKSTVLNMIVEQNDEDNKYSTLIYNAWEDNIFDNPMIPLLGVLRDLGNGTSEKFDVIVDELSSKWFNIAKFAGRTFVKSAIKVVENKTGIELDDFKEVNIFLENEKYKRTIKQFKNKLERILREKKAILFIDELDRCLPEYQIKVLETVYHLLGIKNLTVVIALDKEQLEKTIETKFGDAENTHGYLAKFIDYEFDLPIVDKYNLVVNKFKFKYVTSEIKKFECIMKSSNIQIRDLLKITNELNVILYNKDYPYSEVEVSNIIYTFLILLFKKYEKENFSKYFMNNNNNYLMGIDGYDEFVKSIKNISVIKIIEFLINNDEIFKYIYVKWLLGNEFFVGSDEKYIAGIVKMHDQKLIDFFSEIDISNLKSDMVEIKKQIVKYFN